MRSPIVSSVTLALSLATSITLSACGGGDGKPANNAPPPAKPATGAPVAFEVTKVAPGEEHNGALTVKAYNFSDKKVAGYGIMMRYFDKDGAPLKVKVGTPFEKDHDSWSMSGMKFKCDPTSWCDYEIDHLDVPAAATKAEVIAHSVRALADDGVKFAEPDLWSLEGGGLDWPADPK